MAKLLARFQTTFVYGYILFAQERNIGYCVHLLCQAVQQVQAVLFYGGIFSHHHHAVEEGIDLWFDGSQFGQGGLEIAFGDCSGDFRLQALCGGVQGFFFFLLQQAFIDFAQRGIGFFSRFCTRLLAAASAAASGSCLNAATACSLAVKSSKRRGCLASTAATMSCG